MNENLNNNDRKLIEKPQKDISNKKLKKVILWFAIVIIVFVIGKLSHFSPFFL